MLFTVLSFTVTIMTSIHFVFVSLHYFAASEVIKEADILLSQNKSDPLLEADGTSHRDIIDSAKFDLRLSVLVFGLAIIPSMLWNMHQWAAGIMLMLAIVWSLTLSTIARRQIQSANDTLEAEEGLMERGMKSMQEAAREPW